MAVTGKDPLSHIHITIYNEIYVLPWLAETYTDGVNLDPFRASVKKRTIRLRPNCMETFCRILESSPNCSDQAF